MRKFKPLLSSIIILTLMLSMSVSAWAAIIPDNNTNQSYGSINSGDTMENNYGTIEKNQGIVKVNHPGGLIRESTGGSIIWNKGTVENHDSAKALIVYNCGQITDSNGDNINNTALHQCYKLSFRGSWNFTDLISSSVPMVHQHDDGSWHIFSDSNDPASTTFGVIIDTNSSSELSLVSAESAKLEKMPDSITWHLYNVTGDVELVGPLPYGKSSVESGEIYNNSNEAVTVKAGGTVNINHIPGVIRDNYGLVKENNGIIENNFGIVNSGGCGRITNHFYSPDNIGSNITSVLNHYHKVTTEGDVKLSTEDGHIIPIDDSSMWVRTLVSEGNTLNYPTYKVEAGSGWALDDEKKPDSGCLLTDEGESWSITGINQALTLVAKELPKPPAGSGGEPGIPDPGEQEPEVSNPYSVPSTADMSNMPLWSALFIVFAAAAVLTRKKKA